MLLSTPAAFEKNAPHYSVIYEIAAEKAGIERIVKRSDRQVTLTEHFICEDSLAVVAVNNTQEPCETELEIASNWQITQCVNGTLAGNKLVLPGKTGAILYLEQKK